MLHMGRLGFLRAHELAPRGQIEKQRADFHARARRAAGRFDFDNLSAVDDDLRAFGRTVRALARREDEAADAGDAGQRFAAKPHCHDGGQVFGFSDFARRVPFEAEQGVVAAHAEAVVNHPHQTAPARLNFHRDARGLRVE